VLCMNSLPRGLSCPGGGAGLLSLLVFYSGTGGPPDLQFHIRFTETISLLLCQVILVAFIYVISGRI